MYTQCTLLQRLFAQVKHALYDDMRFLWLQAEDLLDDILSFEAGSLGDGLKDGQAGSLTNIPELQIKPEPLLLTEAEIHALAKDRQKKDNHNMSKLIIDYFRDFHDDVFIVLTFIKFNFLFNHTR